MNGKKKEKEEEKKEEETISKGVERIPVSEIVEEVETPVSTSKFSQLSQRQQTIRIEGREFIVKGIPISLLQPISELIADMMATLPKEIFSEIREEWEREEEPSLDRLGILLKPFLFQVPQFMGLLLRQKNEEGKLESIGVEWVKENCTITDFSTLIRTIIETSNFPELVENFRVLGQKFGTLARG